MIFGICPYCESKVDVGGQPEINNHIKCNTCQMDLVIVWLNPIELLIMDYGDYELFGDDPYHEDIQKSDTRKKENIMATGKPKKDKKDAGKKKPVKK